MKSREDLEAVAKNITATIKYAHPATSLYALMERLIVQELVRVQDEALNSAGHELEFRKFAEALKVTPLGVTCSACKKKFNIQPASSDEPIGGPVGGGVG